MIVILRFELAIRTPHQSMDNRTLRYRQTLMATPDLRDWIRGIDAAGQLKSIKGAERKEEIGGFVDNSTE